MPFGGERADMGITNPDRMAQYLRVATPQELDILATKGGFGFAQLVAAEKRQRAVEAATPKARPASVTMPDGRPFEVGRGMGDLATAAAEKVGLPVNYPEAHQPEPTAASRPRPGTDFVGYLNRFMPKIAPAGTDPNRGRRGIGDTPGMPITPGAYPGLAQDPYAGQPPKNLGPMAAMAAESPAFAEGNRQDGGVWSPPAQPEPVAPKVDPPARTPPGPPEPQRIAPAKNGLGFDPVKLFKKYREWTRQDMTSEDSGYRRGDINMMLLEAGLTMMALGGRGQTAFSALGTGGLAALKGQRARVAGRSESARQRRKDADDLASAMLNLKIEAAKAEATGAYRQSQIAMSRWQNEIDIWKAYLDAGKTSEEMEIKQATRHDAHMSALAKVNESALASGNTEAFMPADEIRRRAALAAPKSPQAKAYFIERVERAAQEVLAKEATLDGSPEAQAAFEAAKIKVQRDLQTLAEKIYPGQSPETVFTRLLRDQPSLSRALGPLASRE